MVWIEWFNQENIRPSFQVISKLYSKAGSAKYKKLWTSRHVFRSDQIRFGAVCVCSRWFVVVGKISKQETEAADEKIDYKIVKQFRGKAGDHNKAIIQSGKHEKIFLNQSVKYIQIHLDFRLIRCFRTQ